MEFLLSWLADSVDLGADLTVGRDARGRATLGAIDEAARRAAAALADRLTACGLAVEALRELGASDGGPDFVLDVEVTSNRPDAMCHRGLARELAVALGASLRSAEVAAEAAGPTDGTSVPIVLEDPQDCPRYVARIVRGLKVGSSPEWLRRRLEAIGLRSINNVVDATNFVLWETGQPLHAFDLATIPGGEIHVRRARAGESLTTLDGKERRLDPEVLVIADRARAIALAGIMGGADTEVSSATTELLIESAHFDRRRIRIGARRLAMHTDASHRFERGADFDACDLASRRCAELVVEIAGGAIDEVAVDAVARRPRLPGWRLERAALERFAGFPIPAAEIERILAGLGFAPRRVADDLWEGTVPSWREADFEPRRRGSRAPTAYPQDLFEEVLRHVGFERVPSTLPSIGGTDRGREAAHNRAMRVRRDLAAFGFAEAIHFAFHERSSDADFPALGSRGEPLALANPLSERFAVLRRSLVPNLVAAAEFNARRGAPGARLFELGHLFPGGEAAEIEAVAWIAGGAAGEPWDGLAAAELLAVKGVGEALIADLTSWQPVVRPAELPGVVAGSGALWLDGETAIGWFGQIARSEATFPLFAAELLLDRLPERAGGREVEPPPRLPGIAADLTLVHAEELAWSELAAAIRDLQRPPAVDFRLKVRYRGSEVPSGAVATTITFDYHGGERTLTQDEVNEAQNEIAAELERRFSVARKEER